MCAKSLILPALAVAMTNKCFIVVLVVFRLHHDKDGVNDDAYAAEATGAEPEDSRPDLAFVEAVHAEIPQQNAEGKRYPFVVFTLSGHSCSFFLKDRKKRCPSLGSPGKYPFFLYCRVWRNVCRQCF